MLHCSSHPAKLLEKHEKISIINGVEWWGNFHDELRTPKYPGMGTAQFLQISVWSNIIDRCFYPIISSRKACKLPFGAYIHNLTCTCLLSIP